jgi:hypothetical protein
MSTVSAIAHDAWHWIWDISAVTGLCVEVSFIALVFVTAWLQARAKRLQRYYDALTGHPSPPPRWWRRTPPGRP